MSNARKLQTEIDRTLKKVEEGIEVFDDIWDKVYNADQQSQKEKYESDLKKEIKKLQRLRDQIKGWLSQSDIKDKSNLLDSRKLIETKMEQFKICERDTKTKAYSKEGLARAATLGPEDAAKEEKRSWLNDCIDKLSELVESLEADVEKLSTGRGRVKNKDSIEKNERRIKKNQWHRTRMEQIIRLLDCDEIDPASLESIKEDVDYYVESAPDDDGVLGVEDEFDIYEDLGLDSRGGLSAKNEEEETKESTTTATKETKSATKKKSISSIDAGIPVIGKATPVKKGDKDKDTSPVKAKGAANGGVTLSKMMASTGGNSVSPIKSSGTPSTTSAISASKDKKGRDGDSNREPPATSWAAAMQKGSSSQSSNSVSSAVSASSSNNTASDTTVLQQNNPGQDSQPSSGDQRGKNSADTNGQIQGQFQQQQQPQRYPTLDQNLLSRPELQVGLSLLQQSMKYTPVDDMERFGTYKPRNPHPTHRLYPTQPPAIIQSGRVFDKLPMDTLFFSFYQQQGTYQQYLAAKQLKKLSWRFNKKYMTWFQRHEEPKITTKEFEQGTYVYFDYESGWCQRIKSDFKFEYCHLEDELDIQPGSATGTQPQPHQNR